MHRVCNSGADGDLEPMVTGLIAKTDKTDKTANTNNYVQSVNANQMFRTLSPLEK